MWEPLSLSADLFLLVIPVWFCLLSVHVLSRPLFGLRSLIFLWASSFLVKIKFTSPRSHLSAFSKTKPSGNHFHRICQFRSGTDIISYNLKVYNMFFYIHFQKRDQKHYVTKILQMKQMAPHPPQLNELSELVENTASLLYQNVLLLPSLTTFSSLLLPISHHPPLALFLFQPR